MGERRQQDVGGTGEFSTCRAATAPRHRYEVRQVAVIEEVVLGEPRQVEPQLVGHFELIERLRIHLGQRHIAAGRAPQIVDDAEAQWLSHGRRLGQGQPGRPFDAAPPRNFLTCIRLL